MDTDGTGEISLDNLKQVLVSNAEAGSLGALTEEEVVDIFNAMRVNKEETTIHWHEFIAAGLTQCRVDDRNLRLAFDRLDSDHKGYITLNDIVNLVGSDDMASEQEMRCMWTESMNNVGSTQEHITYDHFLLIMKGQTEKAVMQHHIDRDLRPKQLESVAEQEEDAQVSEHSEGVTSASQITETAAAGAGASVVTKTVKMDRIEDTIGLDLVSSVDSDSKLDRAHFLSQASDQKSLPNLKVSTLYTSEGSLGAPEHGRESSPATPSKNATWPTAPASTANKVDNQGAAIPFLPKPEIVTRKRSKSMETEQYERAESPVEELLDDLEQNLSKSELGVDTRRALTLPERHDAIKDELASMSALAVNRELYRAHRRMRVSVLDASRRFDEMKAIRARDKLMKEKVKEAMGAGLVMRHGTKLQVTSEAIRKYLDEAMAEQQALLEKATRRGGRGRRNRKKTISDMSAMMSPSMTQDEMGEVSALAMLSQTPDSKRSTVAYDFEGFIGLPELPTGGPVELGTNLAPRTQRRNSGKIQPGSQRRNSGHRIQVPESISTATAIEDTSSTPNLPQIDHKSLRKPTVPGQFLKTNDPFGATGLYGVE
jgi:Ca2+-binding EF-hand superfamily protein